MNIKPLETADDREYVRMLSVEYLRWVFTELNAELDAGWDVDSVANVVDEWMPTLDKYTPPAGQFLLVRVDEQPAGMGALRKLNDDICEIKRMYVRPQFRGQGFAKQMLDHLSAYAWTQGVSLLRLETGIHQHEAIGLYERMGFHQIPPFGDYRDDPLSLFYEKSLTPR